MYTHIPSLSNPHPPPPPLQVMTEHQAELSVLYSSFLLAIYFIYGSEIYMGFPGSSAGKESACNAGNPGSISGLGRSAGEEIGYLLQYSWSCLVAAMRKTLGLIPGLGWCPGEGNGYPLLYYGLENSMDRGAWQPTVHGVPKGWHNWATFTFTFQSISQGMEVWE